MIISTKSHYIMVQHNARWLGKRDREFFGKDEDAKCVVGIKNLIRYVKGKDDGGNAI